MDMLSKRQIKYFKSLQLKKYRDQERLFLVEGAKGVGEVMNSSFHINTLLATEDFLSGINSEDLNVFRVKEDVLQQAGTFKSNNAAIAVVEMPDSIQETTSDKGITLVLDDVRDPGNLGTIIRIADWYGIRKIICSEETADFYNPKVINSTMGSFTRVQLVYTNLSNWLAKVDLPVYGALLNGENIYNEELKSDAIVVMGNESKGISESVQKYINKPVLIPGRGGAESLNVAVSTAVVLDNFFR